MPIQSWAALASEVPEAIYDGQTGFLLNSADDLTGLIDRLVGPISDESLRAFLGAEARRHVEGRFTWQIAASAIKKIVQELWQSG